MAKLYTTAAAKVIEEFKSQVLTDLQWAYSMGYYAGKSGLPDVDIQALKNQFMKVIDMRYTPAGKALSKTENLIAGDDEG